MNSETETPQQDEQTKRQTFHTPVVPAQKARQGAAGHNVRYVLGFSLAAIIIIFLAIWLVYFG